MLIVSDIDAFSHLNKCASTIGFCIPFLEKRLLEKRALLPRHLEISPKFQRCIGCIAGACRNYETLTIGEPLAKHLISLDSYNPSSFVLLSNYCSFDE